MSLTVHARRPTAQAPLFARAIYAPLPLTPVGDTKRNGDEQTTGQVRRDRGGVIVVELAVPRCSMHPDYPAATCPKCKGMEVRRG